MGSESLETSVHQETVALCETADSRGYSEWRHDGKTNNQKSLQNVSAFAKSMYMIASNDVLPMVDKIIVCVYQSHQWWLLHPQMQPRPAQDGNCPTSLLITHC
jgi:hypothetical protein